MSVVLRSAAFLLAGSTALALSTVSAPVDARAPAVFSNATPITVSGDWPPGTATPYPASIDVSGVTDPVTSVTVTLHQFNLPHPKDIDVLLVGPTGVAVMLMSDVSQTEVTHPIELSFAADGMPFPAVPGVTPIESGTYSPKDEAELPGTDGGEPPAPAPTTYTTDLTTFDGVDPNGTWSLYVYADTDTTPNRTIGGGWSLSLNGDSSCQAPGRAPASHTTARRACVMEQVVHYKFSAHAFPTRAVDDVRKHDIIGVEAGAKGQTKPQADILEPVHWRGTLAVAVETTGPDDLTILTLAGRALIKSGEDNLEIHGPVLVHRSNLKRCPNGATGRLLIVDRDGDAKDTVGFEYCGRTLAWKQLPSDAFRVKTTIVDVVDGRR